MTEMSLFCFVLEAGRHF